MEYKILFKENYYKVIVLQDIKIKNTPITIKFLIDSIIDYSNYYNPTNSYILQCRCGEIISSEIPLKNFKCKGNHSNISKNENNLFLLSEITKFKKLNSRKIDILEQISKTTNASSKLKIPQIDTYNNNINNNNNNIIRLRRNGINNLLRAPYIINLFANNGFIPNYDTDLFNNILEMGFDPNHIRISLRLTSNSYEEAVMMLIDSQNNFWEEYTNLSVENNNNNLIGVNFNPIINFPNIINNNNNINDNNINNSNNSNNSYYESDNDEN